jgi:hypothetical protein
MGLVSIYSGNKKFMYLVKEYYRLTLPNSASGVHRSGVKSHRTGRSSLRSTPVHTRRTPDGRQQACTVCRLLM